MEPKNKQHTNFYEHCDLTKKKYIYGLCIQSSPLLNSFLNGLPGTVGNTGTTLWAFLNRFLRNNLFSNPGLSLSKCLSSLPLVLGLGTAETMAGWSPGPPICT